MDLSLYPRDCWYVIGWDRDFPDDAPVPVTILGERIVVWRSAGGLSALADRCPHRAAPLSMGQCEGGNLRCMYHGLLFAGDGQCVEIPGQATIPRQLSARAYPVHEAHSAVWLWPGDAAKADPALIPDFVGYRSPDWAMTPGRLDYAAPARLIHDNLLDLSHITYVHAASFAGGSAEVADKWLHADTVSRTLDDAARTGVRVERWVEDMPSNQAGGGRGVARGDIWSAYEFLLPGLFLQRTERYPAGSRKAIDEQAGAGQADGARPASLMTTFTCQAVLPIDAERACYFFAYGPWSAAAELQDFFAELGIKAFEEDRRMIEAQWQIIRADPHWKAMPLVMDQALLKYDAVVKRRLKAETTRRENETA